MAGQNPLDRRAQRLAERMERRTAALVTRLTEPSPPFRVPANEFDQIRHYLDLRETGKLGGLRASRGGPQTDEDVDRYIAHMEAALSKAAPAMFLRQFQEPPEISSQPLGLHEGLVAALGLDGPAPSVDAARAAAVGTPQDGG